MFEPEEVPQEPTLVVVETADGPVMVDTTGEVVWGELLDEQ